MITLLLIIIYVCFIALGLPDSLLGSAWPIMYIDFNVPLDCAGYISMVICLFTIISSLLSDYFTKKIPSPIITAISIVLTAIGLFCFSICTSYWMMLLFAIPTGFGAGGVDACLNNYVALHFKSRHMSWLHAMWGIGTIISPYVMGFALTKLHDWHKGYLIVSIILAIISIIVFISYPIWIKNSKTTDGELIAETRNKKPLSIKEIVSTKGAVFSFIAFFCYCSLETTSMLWSSTYLNLHYGVDAEIASILACLVYVGLTIGRIINGFLTLKLNDHTLIRLGLFICSIGLILLFVQNVVCAYIGLVILGLGCAPVYPCIIHLTPTIFGEEKSQALIGVEMACAYSGSFFMPSVFGIIANNINIGLFPLFLSVFGILLFVFHELLSHKTKKYLEE